MAEILFYHLTQSRLEETLPNLVERSLERGWRAVVQTLSEERRDMLDTLLWTFSDTSFIAHGTDRDPAPELQPVFLTTEDKNPNQAQIRFCVEGAECQNPQDYQRLVIMFDGLDMEQVEKARLMWKKYKEGDYELTYWQQTPERRWERKA